MAATGVGLYLCLAQVEVLDLCLFLFSQVKLVLANAALEINFSEESYEKDF